MTDRSNYAIGLADDGTPFMCDQPECDVHTAKADAFDAQVAGGTCARYYRDAAECDKVGTPHLCGSETVERAPTQLHIYHPLADGMLCGIRWYPGMMWLNDYMVTKQIKNNGGTVCRKCADAL